MTLDQWILMDTLSQEGENSQAKLAKLTNKDKASVTRILNLLHDKDFVRRVPNPRDKRKSSLKLTTKGLSVIDSAKLKEFEIQKSALSNLSESDVKAFIGLLNTLDRNLNTLSN